MDSSTEEVQEPQNEGTEDVYASESYEKVDWNSLLFVEDYLQKDNFAFACSKALRVAWIKQTSPACAAASVAGAVNCALNLERDSSKAWSQPMVLEVYKTMLEERMRKSEEQLERLLGIAQFEYVMQLVHSTQDKPVTQSPKEVLNSMLKLLETLLPTEVMNPTVTSPTSTESTGSVSPKTTKPKSSKKTAKTKKQPSLKSCILTILKQRQGYAKLNQKKPSTAVCGNWALKEAVARISSGLSESEPGLTSATLLGKSHALNVVSNKDTPSVIATQWRNIWEEYLKPRSALIVHLKNHYVLVYALREWVTDDGEHVRQLLAARRGQTPSLWIDFSEIRSLILSWGGHAILVVKTFPELIT